MERKDRTLRLKKTVLRRLTPSEMEGVLGGKYTEPTGPTCYLTCGSCDTMCPGGGCNDPTIYNTCGCAY
jgi:hypothetical protein